MNGTTMTGREVVIREDTDKALFEHIVRAEELRLLIDQFTREYNSEVVAILGLESASHPICLDRSLRIQ